MSGFLQRLKREVLIASGVIGTNLALRGYDQTENAGWWAINHPDVYRDLIKAWINVGCDYIASGTGSTNRLRLKAFNLEDKTQEINYQLTKIVREVVPKNCYLAFTLDASGIFLPPVGKASPDEVYECYVEQIAIAENVGADLLEVGVSDTQQSVLAMKAAKENSDLPIVGLVHSLSPTPRGFRTPMGLDPTAGAKNLEKMGADVIGVQCGSISYRDTTATLAEIRGACSKPLLAKPNAGVPELIDGKAVHPGTPEEMAKNAPDWVSAGARMVSGCCGTTREHIAKVIAALK